MTPPIWLDEHGQRPADAPACPKCGREDLVLRLRYEHLRMNDWKPFKTFSMVNFWCRIPRAGAG